MSEKRRKNGKQQSCEPCRKAKVKCDHASPVCGRCRIRGRASQCYYHPAPLTKPRLNATSTTQTDRYGIFGISSALPSHGDQPDFRRDSTAFDHLLAAAAADHEIVVPNTPEAVESNHNESGYLGATSYTNALLESAPKEYRSPTNHTSSDFGLNTMSSDGVMDHNKAEFLKKGADVLAIIPRLLPVFPMFPSYQTQTNLAIVPLPIVVHTAEFLEQLVTNHDFLQIERERMQICSRMLVNTSRPLKVSPEMTGSQFHLQFTGDNFRFETLAWMFALAGVGILCGEEKVFGGRESEARAIRMRIRELIIASDACIEICASYGISTVNDVFIWGMLQNTVLTTMYHGDSSYIATRRAADLATAIFALGIHQECKISENVPGFLTHCRRKTFAGSYYIDKTIATFVGRPPRIPMRFSDIQAPLDVSDDTILGGPEIINDEVSKLDPEGYNPDGKFHPNTSLRTRFKMSVIREKILELSLGNDKTDLDNKAQHLTNELEALWESLPRWLKFDDKTDDARRWAKTHTFYTDYLYSHFLLERIRATKCRSGGERHLHVSREMLTTVLMVSKRVFWCQSDWFLLFYGLPAAAVLAADLLRAQQLGLSATESPSLTHRASIIRNLSVFLAALESAAQADLGNRRACTDARDTLGRILDAILDPNPPPSSQRSRQSDEQPASQMIDAVVDQWPFGDDLFGLNGEALPWDPFMAGLDEIDLSTPFQQG
ncbi:hypothetical protein P152DRAFT_399088 [Eremomyces bilateralis CBS 781.70]|uniref:Zn(2)-C6 fungal-type domain-containing protein n=1 Tax=Eremomyces bilateralis CBS 781.70 TaxID=1392243 RepID=A0A6G1G044_9PEZI|nr:uncharacterized protein P152DRAFT_399088 [Eremomyces bilateralis CBS 781.70]KAF1811424.1 hypothetical protein P152DRAFT_399088 [Eremomyces bilateralis CBS 781.70]